MVERHGAQDRIRGTRIGFGERIRDPRIAEGGRFARDIPATPAATTMSRRRGK